MEEGLDTFVVVDGLPKVPEASREKLIKFLLRSLTKWGSTKEDNVFMPLDDKGTTEGFAFVAKSGAIQCDDAICIALRLFNHYLLLPMI